MYFLCQKKRRTEYLRICNPSRYPYCVDNGAKLLPVRVPNRLCYDGGEPIPDILWICVLLVISGLSTMLQHRIPDNRFAVFSRKSVEKIVEHLFLQPFSVAGCFPSEKKEEKDDS